MRLAPQVVTDLAFVMFDRPATTEIPDIIKLFDAGMSLARFNMSHGSLKVSFISQIIYSRDELLTCNVICVTGKY